MYLPMYIKEGNYTCEFRSLASNTGSQIEATEENKNTQSNLSFDNLNSQNGIHYY